MNLSNRSAELEHFRDPRETVRLLDELSALGFDDRAFALLHHFGESETIQKHRNYCETGAGERFRTKTNPLVQQRLALVVAMHKAGRFIQYDAAHFQRVAAAVAVVLPHEA